MLAIPSDAEERQTSHSAVLAGLAGRNEGAVDAEVVGQIQLTPVGVVECGGDVGDGAAEVAVGFDVAPGGIGDEIVARRQDVSGNPAGRDRAPSAGIDRKSTRLNSSHLG